MSEILSVLKTLAFIQGLTDKFDSLKGFFKGDLKYGICIPVSSHIKYLLSQITSENYLFVDLDNELNQKLNEIGETKQDNTLLDIREFELSKRISSTLEEITQRLNKEVIYFSSNYRILKFVGCTKVYYYLPCKEMNLNIDDIDAVKTAPQHRGGDDKGLKDFNLCREDLLNRKRHKLNIYNNENQLLSSVMNLDLPYSIKLKF